MFDPDSLRQALTAASLVTQLGLVAAAGFFVGRWLDGALGTGPWMMLGLTTTAFLAGTFRLLGAVRRLQGPDEPPDPPP